MDVTDAERAYEAALAQLGRLGSSAPLSKRMHAEDRFAQTYQVLVRLGVRPQIRGKYRGGR